MTDGPVRSIRPAARLRTLAIRWLVELAGGLGAGSFARSVVVLAAAGAASQVVVIAASPVVTRLYSPVDIGTLAVYTSLLSLLSVAVSLRFEQTIPMPTTDLEGRELLGVALVANVALSGLTVVAVALVGSDVARLAQSPGLAGWLWLLPISLSALGAFEALSLWAVRTGAFSAMAGAKLGQNVGQVAAQVSLGLLGAGSAGLMVGDAVARVGGCAALRQLLATRGALLTDVTLGGMRRAARQYRRFATISAASGLVNTAVANLPPIILATLYGPAVAGFFALGRLVIFAPAEVISTSIGRVYFGRVTRARNEAPGSLQGLLVRVATRLSLALPAFALVFVASPVVFPIVFGPDWAEVGVYAQILCPALALSFVLQTTNMLLPLGFAGYELVWDLFRLAVALGGVVAAHALGADARTAVTAYAAGLAVSYAGLLGLNVFVLRRHFPREVTAASGSGP
ncbi:MAG TPA: oligosaccharide flippase family protein [Candidatus Limnocylindrales bacterium]|nr:oligosaccharide flippase family protein [Candidatus Limnocylindrales bacterium]